MCIAVRDRIELSKGDLKNNNIAGFVVNPYYFSISLSPPTRRVGVFAIGSYPISPPYNFELTHWKPYNLFFKAYGLSTPTMLVPRAPSLRRE